MYLIFYGVDGQYVNVTEKIIATVVKCNAPCVIPSDDCNRAALFGIDPALGKVKHLRFEPAHGGDALVIPVGFSVTVSDNGNQSIEIVASITNPEVILREIHRKLQFFGGSMQEELPEQLLVAEFLNPKAKVLEIGANIGRNTMTIASILDDHSQLVAIETDATSADVLRKNRDANGFKFHVETNALSMQPLIQNGWVSSPLTKENETKLSQLGYFRVESIDWDSLNVKYGLAFDTLVLDCEGAFYYILKDFPSILDNVKAIFIENDFFDFSQKQFVDETLRIAGFRCVCSRSGGWGPCASVFYQVWKK